MTDRQVFFEMLHELKQAKSMGLDKRMRRTYYAGMKHMARILKEDREIADNMRDVWKCQASGAE